MAHKKGPLATQVSRGGTMVDQDDVNRAPSGAARSSERKRWAAIASLWASVGVFVAILGVFGMWLTGYFNKDVEIKEYLNQISDLRRKLDTAETTIKSLQTQIDGLSKSKTSDGDRHIQFRVKDESGNPCVGFTVAITRADQQVAQVTTKDGGLTSEVTVKVGDEVVVKQGGVVLMSERLGETLWEIVIGRSGHEEGTK